MEFQNVVSGMARLHYSRGLTEANGGGDIVH